MLKFALLIIVQVAAALPSLAQGSAAPPRSVPRAAKPAAPSLAPASLDLAYGAYQRGLYLTAFREATARLDKDPADAAAMTLVGELYNQGLGLRLDPAEAARWYRLAAARGDAHAMASLGLMAVDGRGLSRSEAEARDWLEKAASRGEASASYNLALILMSAGADADLPRIASLLRIGADAEIGDAQHDLGVLYARGRGVPKSVEQAAKLFLRAARNGSTAGEVEYAIAVFNGEGVEKSEAIAARYFRLAAARGNAIAQNRLARLYVTGRGVPRNLVEAAAWHLVASGQGLPDTWLDGSLRELPGSDRARAEQLASERAGTL